MARKYGVEFGGDDGKQVFLLVGSEIKKDIDSSGVGERSKMNNYILQSSFESRGQLPDGWHGW